MIYPILEQAAVVLYKGKRCMAVVKHCGENHEGRYRIGCWSAHFGHTVEFKSSDVELLVVTFSTGEIYRPEHEFQLAYTSAQQASMLECETTPKNFGQTASTAFTPERAAQPPAAIARKPDPIQRVRPTAQPAPVASPGVVRRMRSAR